MVAYTYYISDPRVKKEAETLADAGYNVDFFALRKENDETYKRINNINLYQLNCSHYRGKSNIKYLFSYLIFLFIAFFKISCFFIRKRYLLVHINNMPDFLAFSALIPKIFGSKIILDIHDVMVDVFFNRGKLKSSKIIYKLLIWQEYLSSRLSNHVITVDEYCKEMLISHGIKPEKITVISNFPDEKIFEIKDINRKNNEFNLIYHGTISKIYGLDTVIKGISKIIDRIPGLTLKIIGEGESALEIFELIKDYKLEERINFKNEKVSQEEVYIEMGNPHLGIVSYSCLNTIFSNKLLEYISMGIPALITYNEQNYKYFKEYNLEYYERNNFDSFSEKLLYLYSNKKRYDELRNTFLSMRGKFQWGKEKQKYINLVSSILNK